ncbi:MAG: hypothetical protein AAB110_05735 [Candidatus Desantisbacteria bacterium]
METMQEEESGARNRAAMWKKTQPYSLTVVVNPQLSDSFNVAAGLVPAL